MKTMTNRDPRKLIIYLADLRSEETEVLIKSAEPGGAGEPGADGTARVLRPESAAGRSLLAEALHDYLGRTPAPEELAGQSVTANGKPFFPAYPDFHYNISHSGDYVVCAYGTQPVGIDIQKIPDKAERAAAIAGHFYSEQETDALNRLPDFPMRCLFTRFWTSRESYIKLTGRGLSEPFDSFYPDLDAGRIYSENERGREIYITECQAPEGYCMSVCTYMPTRHMIRHCFSQR